jgi:hypothetical protein
MKALRLLNSFNGVQYLISPTIQSCRMKTAGRKLLDLVTEPIYFSSSVASCTVHHVQQGVIT